MSFLAIDIGNTRLKWACYAHSRPGAQLLAHGAEFLEQIENLADNAWKHLPPPTLMLQRQCMSPSRLDQMTACHQHQLAR